MLLKGILKQSGEHCESRIESGVPVCHRAPCAHTDSHTGAIYWEYLESERKLETPEGAWRSVDTQCLMAYGKYLRQTTNTVKKKITADSTINVN